MKLSKPAKVFLGVCAAVILLGVVWFAFAVVLPIASFFHGIHQQMAAGQKYMDSLSEKDFQVWAERTQKYLSEFDPKASIIDSKPVPEELQQLKILRIDEDTNYVRYVWVGGLDHTYLLVEKMGDGSFQFTAGYNDYSNRVIWPKTRSANP